MAKLVPVLLALVALVGCQRGGDDREAVRQAVIDHLGKRGDMNLDTMTIDVTSVEFRGNEADAMVSFAPKGQGAGEGMSMRYTLERQDGRWVVKGRGAGTDGHGETAPPVPLPPVPPPNVPPGPGGQTELPPGHPPVPETPRK